MSNNCGYEYVNEKSIDTNLKCFVCRKPFIDPVKTNCSSKPHTFCNHCINERIKFTPECPTCRENINNRQSIAVCDEDMLSKLNQLIVKCIKCGKKDIKRGDFSKHNNELCIKAPVSCPAAQFKCPWTGIRADLTKHTSTCAVSQMLPWCLEIKNKMDTQQVEINALNETVRQLRIHKDEVEDENKRLNDKIKEQQKKIHDINKTHKNELQKVENQIKQLNDAIIGQGILIQDLITCNSNSDTLIQSSSRISDQQTSQANNSLDETTGHPSRINSNNRSFNDDIILANHTQLAEYTQMLFENWKHESQTRSPPENPAVMINTTPGVNLIPGINNAHDVNNCKHINNVQDVNNVRGINNRFNTNNQNQINNKIDANNSLSINNRQDIRNVYQLESINDDDNNDNNDQNTNVDARSVVDNEQRVATATS